MTADRLVHQLLEDEDIEPSELATWVPFRTVMQVCLHNGLDATTDAGKYEAIFTLEHPVPGDYIKKITDHYYVVVIHTTYTDAKGFNNSAAIHVYIGTHHRKKHLTFYAGTNADSEQELAVALDIELKKLKQTIQSVSARNDAILSRKLLPLGYTKRWS
jgi:hypothetical protein